MKISVTHYDEKVTIKTKRNDLSIIEFMDFVKTITKTIYNEELVENYWK